MPEMNSSRSVDISRYKKFDQTPKTRKVMIKSKSIFLLQKDMQEATQEFLIHNY